MYGTNKNCLPYLYCNPFSKKKNKLDIKAIRQFSNLLYYYIIIIINTHIHKFFGNK